MSSLRVFEGWVAWFLLLAASQAIAGPKGEAPLRPLPRDVLPSLEPWLERGDLVLMESKPDGTLAQVGLFGLVRAKPSTVFEVLSHPEAYPAMIPSMVRSEIVARHGDVEDVAWEIEIPFKNPEGVNRYEIAAPDHVKYYPISGSVPYGAWLWHVVPLPGGRSIVAHYCTADLGAISWIVRKFLAAWPTFEHGAVATTGIVYLRAVARRAEELERGVTFPKIRYRPGRRPSLMSLVSHKAPLSVEPLGPLLQRGVAALVQYTRDGSLEQVSIIARIHAGPDRVADILWKVEEYPEFIPSISELEVLERSPDVIRYDQHMTMPLVDLEMHLKLKRQGTRFMRISLPGGELPSSMAGWELLPGGPTGTTTSFYYMYYDPGEIAWFVKKLLQREPSFFPGLNLATGLVLVRSVQDRAEGRPAGKRG